MAHLCMLDTRPLNAVLDFMDWKTLREFLCFCPLSAQRFFHPQECLYMMMNHSIHPQWPLGLGFIFSDLTSTQRIFCLLGKRQGLYVWTDLLETEENSPILSTSNLIFHSDYFGGAESWIRFGLEGFVHFILQHVMHHPDPNKIRYTFLDRLSCKRFWNGIQKEKTFDQKSLKPLDNQGTSFSLSTTKKQQASFDWVKRPKKSLDLFFQEPFFLNPSFFHAIETRFFIEQSYTPVIMYKYFSGYKGLCLMDQKTYVLEWTTTTKENGVYWLVNITRWGGDLSTQVLSQILSRFGKWRLFDTVFNDSTRETFDPFLSSSESFKLWESTLQHFEFILLSKKSTCKGSCLLTNPKFPCNEGKLLYLSENAELLYPKFFGKTYYLVS